MLLPQFGDDALVRFVLLEVFDAGVDQVHVQRPRLPLRPREVEGDQIDCDAGVLREHVGAHVGDLVLQGLRCSRYALSFGCTPPCERSGKCDWRGHRGTPADATRRNRKHCVRCMRQHWSKALTTSNGTASVLMAVTPGGSPPGGDQCTTVPSPGGHAPRPQVRANVQRDATHGRVCVWEDDRYGHGW